MARKNAKSTKTAVVSLYCLACEEEPGPQVLTAATTFKQAKKVFHPAKRMVEKTPALQEAFALIAWAKSITCGDNGGYMQLIHEGEEPGRAQSAPGDDGRVARARGSRPVRCHELGLRRAA